MNFLEIGSSLIEVTNPIAKISTVSIPVITVLIAISAYLLKNLILDPFDIKLLHKRKHAGIRIAKTLTILFVFTILFLSVEFYINLILIEINITYDKFLIFLVLYSLFFIFILLILGILHLFKGIRTNMKKKKILSTIYTLSSILLFVLVGIFLNLLSGSNNYGWKATDTIFLFLFTIMPSFLVYSLKSRKILCYELNEIIRDPEDISKYKLSLDYFINDSTSVLSNKDTKAIRKDYDDYFILEIYKIKEDPNISDTILDNHSSNT